MFRQRMLFDRIHVQQVLPNPGVYVIYRKYQRQPLYVGRSRRDIRRRLLAHLNQRGNSRIAQAVLQRELLTFEYEHLLSVEQVESILIRHFGTTRFFNLRRETDPADWI